MTDSVDNRTPDSGGRGSLQEPLSFLAELDRRSVHYTLGMVRPESLMVEVAIPGERWEVEFMVDGSVDVERFRSDGTIGDRSMLDELWGLTGD